jgi:glutamine synthetase
VLPAALGFQRELAETLNATAAAGVKCPEMKPLLQEVCDLACELRTRTKALEKALGHDSGTPEAHAKHFRDRVIPAMNAVRETADAIELVLPSESWPLPTYREMMFIK